METRQIQYTKTSHDLRGQCIDKLGIDPIGEISSPGFDPILSEHERNLVSVLDESSS